MSRVRRLVWRSIAILLGVAFAGFMVSCLLALAIWPGQIKLVSFLFCTDAQPDPFVVADRYSPEPGETTINFTLYCMGPRGDTTDHGFFLPFLAVSALNGIAVVVLVQIASIRRRLRRTATSAAREPALRPSAGEELVGATGQRHDDTARAEPPESERRAERSAPPPGSTNGPFVD